VEPQKKAWVVSKKRKKKQKATETQQADADDKKPRAKQEFGQWALGWLKSIVIALVIWFFLQAFLIKSFRIISDSMESTFLVGDWLFVNKALYGAEIPLTNKHLPAIREPRAGELIVLTGIEQPVLTIVKRVIGVAGDTLEMRADSLFRNGDYVPEPYVQHVDSVAFMDSMQRQRSRNWQLPHLVDTVDRDGYLPDLRNWGPFVIPADHLFTMGDNRDSSHDGRHWGFLPRKNLLGRPIFIYYSFDRNDWRPLPFITAVRWNRVLRRPR
jgi:signal peptidase I